jgi:hypothetical protein
MFCRQVEEFRGIENVTTTNNKNCSTKCSADFSALAWWYIHKTNSGISK